MYNSYKYYLAITSQLPFCSTPIRLDTYNRCSFGCEYCFAATREGFGRPSEIQIASPESLRKRLKRVFSSGVRNSSLDEFLARKVPIQLGGMSDPFPTLEKTKSVSLEIIKILNEYEYPFIISTKSDVFLNADYISLLKESNVFVRFSTTVAEDVDRKSIDKGCPELHKIFSSAEKLSSYDIPVSFRFQPVIPGLEENFIVLLEQASKCGVKQISVEYLKVSLEANKNFGKNLKRILKNNPIDYYKKKGAKKIGHEYLLPLEYRKKYLLEIYKETKRRNILFGFADNDLLLHSDGNACCHGANLFLKNATFFNANIVSVAKRKNYQQKIYFSEYLNQWLPNNKISTYLNSSSRLPFNCTGEEEWLSLLRKAWLGLNGVYSPDFFDGITKTNKTDDYGLPIYKRIESIFEKELNIINNFKS